MSIPGFWNTTDTAHHWKKKRENKCIPLISLFVLIHLETAKGSVTSHRSCARKFWQVCSRLKSSAEKSDLGQRLHSHSKGGTHFSDRVWRRSRIGHQTHFGPGRKYEKCNVALTKLPINPLCLWISLKAMEFIKRHNAKLFLRDLTYHLGTDIVDFQKSLTANVHQG